MRYVIESYKTEISTMAYRFYITDCLKALGRFENERYYDIHNSIINADKINNINPEEESNKIISNIKDKLTRMR